MSGSERPRRTDTPVDSMNATSTKLCEIWCSAHESTDPALRRSIRPPMKTTVVAGRTTTVDAIANALVTTTSGRSAGSISARHSVAAPAERMTEPRSGSSSRAAFAISAAAAAVGPPGGSSTTRSTAERSTGIAPPWTRRSTPLRSRCDRSRRMVSVVTASAADSSLTSTRPADLAASMMCCWRSSANITDPTPKWRPRLSWSPSNPVRPPAGWRPPSRVNDPCVRPFSSSAGDADRHASDEHPCSTIPRPQEPDMTTHTPPEPVTGRDVQESPWANGLTIFAAAMMMIIGFWQALAGIAAVAQDKVYAATPEYIYAFDVTGWGWIHLLLGILIVCAGVAVFMGSTWARMVAIVLASLSMIANFAFIPHYPIWSLTIIALDAAVIWALATYRREI